MRTLGSLLLLCAVALFYLSEIDRQSPLALSVVEVDSALRFVHAWSLAALLGLLLWAPSLLQRFLAKAPPPTVRRAGHRPAQDRARQAAQGQDPGPARGPSMGGSWREAILGRVRGFDAGPGARILVDQAQGVPLTLSLEHLSPRHCEAAVTELAHLLQGLPLPPRLRVSFDQCPEGPAPRHHLVAKALGAVLDPGSFKATATADQVEVMFLSPDPRWRTEW